MPRPLARDPASGTFFTVDPSTNQWRPLTDDEWGRLRPSRVLDEMGVEGGERFILKNFLNPGTAALYLRSLPNPQNPALPKYDVLPYGHLNFAVRPFGTQEPWRLVDPHKGGLGEFFRDLWDVSVGDILLPTAGAAVGALGGPLGLAAGGAASELARQGIGAAITGDPGNISLAQAGVIGAVAGALPVAGRALVRGTQAGLRGIASGLSGTTPGERIGAITRLGETFLSRISGVRPGENLRVLDIFMQRARTMPRPLIPPSDVVSAYRIHMDTVAKPVIDGLVRQRDQVLTDVTVNMRPTIESILLRPQPALTERTTLVQRLVGFIGEEFEDPVEYELRSGIQAILRAPTVEGVTMSLPKGATQGEVRQAYDLALGRWLSSLEDMPAPHAARLRTFLQDIIDRKGGFGGVAQGAPGAAAPAGARETRSLQRFSGRWVRQFHRELSGRGTQDAVDLDDLIHTTVVARNRLREFFDIERDTAENILRRAFEPGNEHIQRAVAAYDAAFPGTQWRRIIARVAIPEATVGAPGTAQGLAREAAIGLSFTPRIESRGTFGLPAELARPVATGAPIGTAFIAGAVPGSLTGLAAGGPLGAAVGAAAGGTLGFLAASPRVLVKATPTVVRAGRAVRGVAGRLAAVQAPPLLGAVSGAAASVSLQGIARSEFGKTLVRQEPPRERPRRLLVGG